MPSKSGRPRPSLQTGLDREIYQVVRKLQEEQANDAPPLSVYSVYDSIKRSNSSLSRRPKKLLQDSIDRVLAVLQEDEGDDEELGPLGGDYHDLREEVDAGNIMNRSIVASYRTSGITTPRTDTPGAATPAANGETSVPSSESTKKRKEQRLASGEPAQKKHRSRREEEISTAPPSHVRLEDVGGVDDIKQQLKDHLVLPLLCAEEYARRKIPIPRAILLHGPPGCGKTLICKAFASKLGVPFFEISGPSIVHHMSGESEKQVRDLFQKAKECAPALIFIDEIDSIAPKRDSAQASMEKRIVAQLLVSMDSLEAHGGKPVIVLAATNRPDSLDPALRRGGRFDTEINMGVPNESMRQAILRALTRETQVSADVDFEELAKRTSGFVGADLRDLVGKAGTWSMDRFREALERQAAETEPNMDIDDSAEQFTVSDMDKSISRLIKRVVDKQQPRPTGFEDTSISMEAFLTVLPHVQPSSKREGFATIPDITWADIGALQDVREELQTAVVEPIKNPERYRKVGISAPTGILLWGPPGCGKTLLAKAVAAESKANFISVKGPELLNKYVGESERAVRQVFMRARSSVPCVIFFDELDALVPRRNDALSEASARVVNTLLTELDGLSTRGAIYVVAATNRPDIIDEAMLRPGRLETLLWVGLPQEDERVEILRALIRQSGVIKEELAEVARDCKDFSGADLSALLRKAGQNALRRGSDEVQAVDFEAARGAVRTSVQDTRRWDELRKKFGGSR